MLRIDYVWGMLIRQVRIYVVIIMLLFSSTLLGGRENVYFGVDLSHSYRNLSWLEYSISQEKHSGVVHRPYLGAYYSNINVYGVGAGVGFDYGSSVMLWTINFEHSIHGGIKYGTGASGRFAWRVFGQSIYQIGAVGSAQNINELGVKLRYSNRIYDSKYKVTSRSKIDWSIFLYAEKTIGILNDPLSFGVKVRWILPQAKEKDDKLEE